MAIIVVLSVIFGFFSYRMSLRITRGPQRPVTKPYLRYFGYSLLATFLAESIAEITMAEPDLHTIL